MRNLFAIAVVALLWSPLASASTKIPLFLKSQSSEGFTDPSEDRRDSEKDLLKIGCMAGLLRLKNTLQT